MKELLRELYTIPGVSEACIFNKTKGPLYVEDGSESLLLGERLQTVGMHFVRLFQMGGMAGLHIESGHFYFNKFVVIGILLDAGTVLLTICEAHVNCSLVTTTVNMLSAEILQSLANGPADSAAKPGGDEDTEQEVDESSLSDSYERLKPYLDELEEIYFSILGPVGGLIMNDATEQWRLNGPARIDRIPELKKILADETRDPLLAKEFLDRTAHIA